MGLDRLLNPLYKSEARYITKMTLLLYCMLQPTSYAENSDFYLLIDIWVKQRYHWITATRSQCTKSIWGALGFLQQDPVSQQKGRTTLFYSSLIYSSTHVCDKIRKKRKDWDLRTTVHRKWQIVSTTEWCSSPCRPINCLFMWDWMTDGSHQDIQPHEKY